MLKQLDRQQTGGFSEVFNPGIWLRVFYQEPADTDPPENAMKFKISRRKIINNTSDNRILEYKETNYLQK